MLIQISKIFEVALSHLRDNKLHGSLATLGVIVGSATLIATLSVGEGVKRQVLRDIEALGTNLVFVRGQGTFLDPRMKHPERVHGLTTDDIPILKQDCPEIRNISAQLLDRVLAGYKERSVATNLEGTTPDSVAIRNWKILQGRYLWQRDLDDDHKVCVLGAKLARALFVSENPVGQTITLDNTPYSVIGVLEPKGNVFNIDYDDRVIIPLTTAQQRSSTRDGLDSLIIAATSSDEIPMLSKEVAASLRRAHGTDNFTVWSQDEYLRQREKILYAFQILMGSLAIISLLVGGIGIMNIMLAAVHQRIREIGIRKAVGAKQNDILGQFLAESVLISVLGGSLGIGLGFLLGFGVAKSLARYLPLGEPWVSVFSLRIVVVAFLFAAAVGILFGLYPAVRASKLNPSDALRYE